MAAKIVNPLTIVKTGGSTAPDLNKPVRLYDYDGKLLFSYTKEEIQALDALPTPPEKSWMSFSGWNWSLSTIKNEAANDGICIVGATYERQDGATVFRIRPYGTALSFTQDVAGGTLIDWGDGTTDRPESTSVDITHPYPLASALVEIKIIPDDGNTIHLATNSLSNQSGVLIYDCFVGKNVVVDGFPASPLRGIAFSKSCRMGTRAFNTPRFLPAIIIPSIQIVQSAGFANVITSILSFSEDTNTLPDLSFLHGSGHPPVPVVIPSFVQNLGYRSFIMDGGAIVTFNERGANNPVSGTVASGGGIIVIDFSRTRTVIKTSGNGTIADANSSIVIVPDDMLEDYTALGTHWASWHICTETEFYNLLGGNL